MSKPQPEQPVAEQMLTIPETGIRLAVSPRKVWALIAAGELTPYRFGARATRVAEKDVARYIANARQEGR